MLEVVIIDESTLRLEVLEPGNGLAHDREHALNIAPDRAVEARMAVIAARCLLHRMGELLALLPGNVLAERDSANQWAPVAFEFSDGSPEQIDIFSRNPGRVVGKVDALERLLDLGKQDLGGFVVAVRLRDQG